MLAFVLGGFSIYAGTMMGFACPGCSWKTLDMWLYTGLPWMGGPLLFALAGYLYHLVSRPKRSMASSIGMAISFGIGALFALFFIAAVIGGILQR